MSEDTQVYVTPGNSHAAPPTGAHTYPPEFLTIIQPGNALRINYGPEAVPGSNTLRHIRAIVDETEVVYRIWRGPTRGWRYEVATRYSLFYEWHMGILTLASTGGNHE